MANQPTDQFHVLLDITALNADEKAREKLNDSIIKLGPGSVLAGKSTFIQQAVAAVSSTFTAYKAAGQTAHASAQQAAIDAAAHLGARNANNKALGLLRSATQHTATSLDEITGIALEPWVGKPPVLALLPPDQLDVKLGKAGSGKAAVSVHELGKTRRHYAAEGATDPAGPWSALKGAGKSRKLTGKSGTSIWVRFALIRGQLQSDWSAPVLVTFP